MKDYSSVFTCLILRFSNIGKILMAHAPMSVTSEKAALLLMATVLSFVHPGMQPC
jgi:hypothetical protein